MCRSNGTYCGDIKIQNNSYYCKGVITNTGTVAILTVHSFATWKYHSLKAKHITRSRSIVSLHFLQDQKLQQTKMPMSVHLLKVFVIPQYSTT